MSNGVFTRSIEGIGLLNYEERLQKLGLTTLLERRARGDLIEAFKILREHRITHGDLKASNILLRWERPVLIDLDAMRQHRTVSSYHNALNNDVCRFLQNWQNSPQLLDIARRLLAAEKFPA